MTFVIFGIGPDRLDIHHRHVAALAEKAIVVVNIGDAAGHARREVAPRLPQHGDDATRHIFAAMVAHALDDGGRTWIANGETFTSHALQIGLAGDGAVKHGVADDDVLRRHALHAFRRAHDHAATG